MDSQSDLERFRRKWAQLLPDERWSAAEACGWSTDSVRAAFRDVRIFDTTPAGDLAALAQYLGVTPLDRTAIAGKAIAAAQAQLRTRAHRGPDPEEAGESALRLLRRRSLPVNLDDLARRMGVDRILERPTLVDGRLLSGPDGIFVEVSSKRGYARQRFTIAHELGHLWLAQRGRDSEKGTLGWREEERFCDQFAASVLMPRIWIAKRAKQSQPDLRTLELLSLEARTSLSATLIRVREVDSRWTASLLKFRPGPNHLWRVVAVTGASHRLLNRLACTPDTGILLKAAIGMQKPLRGQLRLLLDGEPIEVGAEAIGNQRTVVAFARLTAGS